MTRLAGQHALVTGANRGIGAAVARTLARAGADVTLLVRDAKSVVAVEGEVRALGVRTGVVVADVTDLAALVRACDAAAAALGPVTILVNNAGTATSMPFLKTEVATFERMMAMHLLAPVVASQAVLPAMVARGTGRIVNIASIAGLVGGSYISAYVSAKHAMVGLTRALAVEFAEKGVMVNAVCPGYTDTDLVGGAVSRISTKTGLDATAALDSILQQSGQSRLVTTDEVAAAVLAFCDPMSRATGEAQALMGTP